MTRARKGRRAAAEPEEEKKAEAEAGPPRKKQNLSPRGEEKSEKPYKKPIRKSFMFLLSICLLADLLPSTVYAQTLIVAVLIVVHFGGVWVIARNPPGGF